MKVLLISESPLKKVGKIYYSVDTWIKFPVKLADYCQMMTIWAPVKVFREKTTSFMDSWRLDKGKLNIEHHDYYYNFVTYYKLWWRRIFFWRKKAAKLINNHDIILLRLPSPMLFLVISVAKRLRKKLVLFVAGDMTTASDRIIKSRGLKKIIYNIFFKFLINQEVRYSKYASLVYAYSNDLAKRYYNSNIPVRIVRTPHLSLDEFQYRVDTCRNKKIKLLRICWLIPCKGIIYLLDSIKILAKKGYDVELELVGKERNHGYQQELEDYTCSIGIDKLVHFSGWIPHNELRPVYMRNDIHIISSLSEGIPRVIVEGAAHGLPLVCTSVGGCVNNLEHRKDALLVPPRNSEAISGAIRRIITDNTLRRSLIKQGYKMAKNFTFDVMGKNILQDLISLHKN